MKKLFVLATLMISTLAVAEVSPGHVENMLDQMVKEKVISPEEAVRAKTRLHNMNKDQWAAINTQAEQVAARSPASAATPSNNAIREVNSIDLDGAQFKQIQADMKKIVPQSKD